MTYSLPWFGAVFVFGDKGLTRLRAGPLPIRLRTPVRISGVLVIDGGGHVGPCRINEISHCY